MRLMGRRYSQLGSSWLPTLQSLTTASSGFFPPVSSTCLDSVLLFGGHGFAEGMGSGSYVASFLLWYLQGNQAQPASPANVIF